ncbi:hypothetical protein [Levilactobacillus koreensis]|uniref:Surface layer protein A domain-containing protein n=1 Tax=Levilactobacillus koreensis TaxID=637971 RepID=A0AAC8UXJ2_9LACO|nr:hypothetical protein [Levilactobacillus koreensis]AKP65762.1 hypothetical protein ABN16_12600 [Levilactobacillus koreensis]
MKKSLVLMTVLGLVAPMALAVPASAKTTTAVATTAKAKQGKTYTIVGSSFFKQAKTVHTKDAKPVVYKAGIAADRPTMTLTAKGSLKAGTIYKITKQATLKLNAKKNQKYSYVKGQGWVVASKLTAGKFKAADGIKAKAVTYTIVSSSFFKTAKTFHTKDAKPVVHKAFIAADRPTASLTAKGHLKAGTTYKVTKQLKLKNSAKKTRTFSYVKGQGWVLKSALTGGQFKNAD